VSGTLTIRRMQRGDAATWQTLFASVADEGLWIGAESPAPDWGDAMAAKFVDSETDVMFLAFVDDRPVGWISAESHADGRELGLGIIDGYRGRGIGSALMETIIDWAGEVTLVLRVFPHNERARALYRKFGFVELEHKYGVWPRRNGEFWDLIFMQRTSAPI
jgi:GNAT superfamily N-acetyltransferase